MAAQFEFMAEGQGGRIALVEKRLLGSRRVPVGQWSTIASAPSAALRYLQRLLADVTARADGDSLWLPTPALLDMPSSVAGQIGLPAVSPLSLRLSLQDRIEASEGHILFSWSDQNLRTVLPVREGMFLTSSHGRMRLSAQLFRLVEAVDAYNATRGQQAEARISAWAPVQSQLEGLTGSVVVPDQILSNFRIYQAGAFALDVRQTTNGPVFDPVLMAPSMRADLEDNTSAPESDAAPADDSLRDNLSDALLTPDLQRSFVDAFSKDAARARSSYVLGRNQYLVVAPDLQAALDVVKQVRRSAREDRSAFVRNPRSTLAQALPDLSESVGTLFVETKQYSERVKGLGLWVKPALPWLQRKGTGWLPERFILRVGSTELEMDAASVEVLSAAGENARAEGREELTYRDTIFRTEDVATALGGLGESDAPPPEFDRRDYEAKQAPDRNVLLMEGTDNLGDDVFVAPYRARPLFAQKLWPADAVPTPPKPHQTAGFSWLVNAWTAGLPGALLADDMGLGKTLQALAFLAWFRTNRAMAGAKGSSFSGPILIVAPTALLRNWQREAEIHLSAGVLGECVEAFGPGLARLKTQQPVAADDALDVGRLQDADWILTTYETLASYHRAFGRVAYGVAVFDEMQKIKAPDTINTHAAKVMNAEFVLGMTGTPIENRIEDIWCIMDRVAPGHFGALKSFSGTYGKEEPEALKSLKAKLDQPTDGVAPLMLRRMKHDHLKGLPDREIKVYRDVPMPPEQAEAYGRVVAAASGGIRSKGDMLKTIHALRGISLHPSGSDGLDPYNAPSARKWSEGSARVAQTLMILEDIQRSREKVLVFIEDRAVQSAFAAVVAARLNLPAEPEIINGEVAGDRRQQIVDRFQSRPPGFDLLLLSPKAAGIGLTITAANHVIHLSRWWNPAVEDQCNDRVYRIGQLKPVTVHIPLAVHPEFGDASFDVKLDGLLERKRLLSRDMLAPPVSDSDTETLFESAVNGV